ncbi:MAG: CHAT domain-containing protein [Clostridiales bacterium]|nr:CHAT domain-containing protein [Clostridiales bacterium]
MRGKGSAMGKGMLALCLTACLALGILPGLASGEDKVTGEAVASSAVHLEGREERALLIGFDEFLSRPSTYPSSTNNVYAMQETFQEASKPLETLLIPQVPITDPADLAALIQETFAGADEDDVSYLYISTHGVYDPTSDEEPALLLSDGQREGRITPAQLEAAFEGIKGTKVIWLDACNSGAFIGKGQVAQPERVHFLGKDFKVLTSSGALEESWYWSAANPDKPEDQGAGIYSKLPPQGAFYFTQTLSQGLGQRYGYPADINRDGLVTLSELYEYLLQNHAASTPQVYPQQDSFVVFHYDVNAPLPQGMERSPILDVTFSGTMLDIENQQLTLEYIVTRPIRVAYQIVYQRDGKWRFDEAQLLYDDVERFTAFGDQAGAVSAGRKVRTLSLRQGEESAYGYVMVQLVSIDKGRLTIHAGRVLCVPPAQGNLRLKVDVKEHYHTGDPKELCIFVEHAYPSALSIAVVNARGEVVRRLCHRRSTRPAQTDPAGSLFYWDGTDKNGDPLPPGTYRIRASAAMNELTFTVMSQELRLD